MESLGVNCCAGLLEAAGVLSVLGCVDYITCLGWWRKQATQEFGDCGRFVLKGKGRGKGKGREEERVGAFRESEEESVEKRREARLRSFGVAWRPRGWSFCFARRSVHRC